MRKIAYVGRLVRTFGAQEPSIAPGDGLIDAPVEEIRRTVAQFFRVGRQRYLKRAQGFLDDDLAGIFRKPDRLLRPMTEAVTLLRRQRKFVEASVRARVHPKDQRVVADLLEKIRVRLNALGLVYLDEEHDRTLSELYGLVLHKTLLFNRFGTFRDA
jgi:hypothetical protein